MIESLREQFKRVMNDEQREWKSTMPLFKQGEFTSHSGLQLADKIDCDALTDEDWEAQAKWFSDRIGFGKVIGIKTGGTKLAEALQKYASPFGPVLIIDDVLTTGRSMEKARVKYPEAVGAACLHGLWRGLLSKLPYMIK